MSVIKERIDVLVVSKGLFESREKARASIMAGKIFVDGIRVDKCGEKVKVDSNIEFKGEKLPYVSRGGLKLEKAIKDFGLNLKNKVCLDIGASTGGFTDCMLQNGASKVFSIDVGYGQFAWKLRVDPRVTCMERTNVRYVKPEDIGESCGFASIDVSFISLKTVIPPILDLLQDKGEVVALIKPQFEAGKEKVGKKGVVRDPEVHKEVITNIVSFLINHNLTIIRLDYSPIKGPEGNIEYLVYFCKDERNTNFNKEQIDLIVNKSHSNL
ncbi:TlyA family RNA methyltransferase [Clostridium algidicarnis]|uniref:TlyA family RNA methyltransferase n=1 Tax=Clostridium algidicarnis TaxID=37659 RepID=UPI001C0DD960|nr:TlyA family RNA methyltransferase [Clostridium algidicarnis]MBU3195453.1 TlyA family RNA methyltransferase [Clostridium algidicarnis]MBU3208413.1 TlyA family RNA methyltransferase [Clostridium algidicarnis]MBU3226991.1 TlyA family RNA methyltransferase [Clostridium algidicarnis]MBU3250098.1 TlyA family RNA methyltransferase [Clostridium algidicarnis]